MSKTKGNVLDPIEVIEKYGTMPHASRWPPWCAGTDIASTRVAPKATATSPTRSERRRFMFMNVDRIAEVWSGHSRREL